MSHRDHCHRFNETDAPVANSDQSNKSIIDMANPDAVRAVFNHSARSGDAERESGNELSFDSPYANDDFLSQHHHSKSDRELRHILKQLAPILQELMHELDPSSESEDSGGEGEAGARGGGRFGGGARTGTGDSAGSGGPRADAESRVFDGLGDWTPYDQGGISHRIVRDESGTNAQDQGGGSDSFGDQSSNDANSVSSSDDANFVSGGNDTPSNNPSTGLDLSNISGVNLSADDALFSNQTFTNGKTSLDVAHIKGVNLSGGEWGGDEHWPTTQEIREYAAKGFNTIRLAMSWEKLQPQLGGPLDQNELRHLDEILRTAAEVGIKVMPEMHNYDRYELSHAPGDNGAAQTNNGTIVGQDGLPVSALSDLWTKVVKHVNSDATLSSAIAGWDLMNEPYNTNGTWAQTALEVDQAIRATGDQHTVIVEGDNWATDFNGLEQLNKIDPNIAFSAHSYWYQNGSGDANVGVNAIKDFENWLAANDAVGFIGEFGVPVDDPSWDPAVVNFIKETAAHGLGNMVWAGGPSWGGNPLSVEPEGGVYPHVLETIVQANEEYL